MLVYFNTMAEGYISYINIIKKYGFIESPDLSLDYIFFHNTNCEKSYKYIQKGDKINFDLNQNSENNIEAINISFIKNASLNNLREDFENNKPLKGFLKKIDDRYYVKDRDTYIFIRLKVSNYEINLKEVYEDNLNELIDYKIIMLTEKNKIRAINMNRQFLHDFKSLSEGNKMEGLIIGNVKNKGYKIKIYDKILGFLPNSFVKKTKRLLQVGDLINVTCINVNHNFENVVFNLTENIDNDKQLII